MNENPYSASGMLSPEQPRKLPFFKAWLLFFLLATLVSAGVGMLVGFIAGVAMVAADVDQVVLIRVCQVLGFVVSLPISFVCFKWSVQKYLLKPEN